jgi:hypothetical protein
MNPYRDTHVSASDRLLAMGLAAFSMFIVGYTATRLYLSQTDNPSQTVNSSVIGHQATLWSELGRR